MPSPDQTNPRDTRSNDEQLLARIAAGDERAFSELFRRWAPRLGTFILRATGCPDTTEDLVQEVFIRILRAAPRYESRGQVSAWIYRIAANLTYSYWRKRNRAGDGSSGISALAERAVAPRRQAPDQLYERGRFTADLYTAVDKLPLNQRMAFLLKMDQGLTYAQVGEVLQCPEGTVKSRFHHALLKLRTGLRDWSQGFVVDETARPKRTPRAHGERDR